jgi:hypothetical protein
MECPLFHTTAFINDYNQTNTLIDNGSMAYALMNKQLSELVLRNFLDDFCSAHVDDILIFSSGSLQDHRTKVCQVLQRLLDNGLTLDIGKCKFETKATKSLGFIVEAGTGIRMDPEKVKAIAERKRPGTVRGVRSFLGFANYYWIFINLYTDIAKL